MLELIYELQSIAYSIIWWLGFLKELTVCDIGYMCVTKGCKMTHCRPKAGEKKCYSLSQRICFI